MHKDYHRLHQKWKVARAQGGGAVVSVPEIMAATSSWMDNSATNSPGVETTIGSAAAAQRSSKTATSLAVAARRSSASNSTAAARCSSTAAAVILPRTNEIQFILSSLCRQVNHTSMRERDIVRMSDSCKALSHVNAKGKGINSKGWVGNQVFR
jgi:hypothetical protein